MWYALWGFLTWFFGEVEEGPVYCDCEDCIEMSWWRAIA